MNDTQTDAPAGIVNLYKPPGRSSAKYVYRLRRVFGIRKVGHAGTLDPFADGVLLGCVGRATKLVERLMSLPKHYRTTLRLGVTNDTYDTERPFVPVPAAKPLPRGLVEQAVAEFVGEIEQVPPIFSAIKIRGVPSYRLAQRGDAVPQKARRVRVHHVGVLDYCWPSLRLEIHCGRGTYIRAIARDLGERLGCGACCEALTRTAIGPFSIEQAVNLDTTPQHAAQAALVPIADALRRIEAHASVHRPPDGHPTASPA